MKNHPLRPLLAGLTGALLWALPASATSLSLQEAPATPKASKHLIHTKSGSVLRGKARPLLTGGDEGGWEVRLDGKWVLIPGDQVARAVRERDVLATARSLERELRGEDDPLRLLAHCDWLVHEGLYIEALEELNDLLAEHPDHPEVVAFCSEPRLPLALPELASEEEVPKFLSQVARSKNRVLRERAIARLAGTETDPLVPGLLPILREELVHAHSARRALATLALHRLAPGRETLSILRRSLLDGTREVRQEANRALRTADDARVLGTLVRALDSRHESIRTRSIEAFAEIGHRAAVAPLIGYLAALQSSGGSGGMARGSMFSGTWTAYVQGFDVEVAQGAAIADPQVGVIGQGSSLTAGVVSASQVTITRQRVATRKALEKLTGVVPGRTSKAWLDWWEKNGDDWSAANPPPPDRSYPKTPGGG